MSTDQIVAPDAATLNEAPVAPAEQPEVAEPETTEEQAAPEAEADPREKAVRNLQRRVDRLTAAKYQTAAEAEQARREAQELRQRLAQYEGKETPQQTQQVDPVALATEIATIREVTAKSNQVASDGKKRFEGFDNAVKTLIDEAGPLVVPVAPNASVGRPTPLGEAILAARDPAAVIDFMGKNPEVAGELHGLTVVQLAYKVASIEAELSKPREPKTSNAPKPVTPVKPTNRDSGGLSPQLSPEEWQRRFYQQRAERYR